MASEPRPYLTILGFLHAAVDMLGLALGFYAVTHGEIVAGLGSASVRNQSDLAETGGN